MRRTAVCFITALLLFPVLAGADVSPWMSYQGVLRDAGGSPVPDGSYSVQFSIFNVESGGAILWTETQAVATSGGVFNVHLGSVVALDTLAWDVPYWLGMRIEGEPWLVPRTPFTTVPYAARAVTAETVIEGDTDWSIDGNDVYHETGDVGIGMSTGAGARLDVLAGSTRAARFVNDAQGFNFAVHARNEYGTAGAFFGGSGTDSYPSPHAALYARGEADHRALHAVSDDRYAIYAHSNTNQALHASTTSGTVCAQFDGGQVIVNDRLRVNEFYMNPGTAGHVLTSDSYGLGTWQPPAAIPDSDWTISGSNVYRDVGGVGIGWAAIDARLDVMASPGGVAGDFVSESTGTSFTLRTVNNTGTAGGFFSGAIPTSYPPTPSAVYGRGGSGSRGATFSADDEEGVYAFSNTSRALLAMTNGSHCAYFGGGEVWVDDRLKTNEFEMAPGTAGHVLTSDASGVGTWQAPPGGADSDWTIAGDDVYHDVGNVGIGTVPGSHARLDVLAGDGIAADFSNNAGPALFTVRAENGGGTAGGFFANGSAGPYPATPVAVFGYGNPGAGGGHFHAEDGVGLKSVSGGISALDSSNSGTGFSGRFTGGIGISVEGEVRTDAFRMATGGSVGHVLTSDAEGIGTWQAPAAAADSDWTINGDDVYHDVGYVGIGTSTPARRLDILETTQTCARFQNASAGDDFAISVRNEGGTAGGFYAGSGADYFPVVPSALFASAQSGYRGATISAIDEHGLTVSSSGDRALVATTTGGSCAYFGGGDVWVDDLLRVGEFEMSPGSAGHVLTSDASGVGTWQPPAAASDNDWTVVGSDMSSAVSGRVGIGTVSPLAKLGVHSDLSEEALRVSTAGSSVPRMVNLQRTSMPASGNDILQLTVPAGSPEYFQFIEADIGGVERFSVHGDGYVFSSGGGDFYTSDLDTNFPALRGVMTATGSADVVGVYGESTPAAGFGIGGEFVGGRWGVKASVVPEGTGEHYALYGEIDGGPGTNYGVAGLAQNGVGNYGVWGGAAVGSGYAGYFAGDSHTTGTLTAGTKSFKIDHPLDPENKYLMHSSVESDERMNIYNGNVVLDARGEAWVEMPDWFEVLNQDFRYQLTAMDAPGPNLHIAERIANGRFKIAGGTAGMEVSWMVTGVRHDPVAVATPLSVEVDKPAHEAGKYLNPEAYGKPASMGLGHIEVQETATPKRAPARVREMDANDGE